MEQKPIIKNTDEGEWQTVLALAEKLFVKQGYDPAYCLKAAQQFWDFVATVEENAKHLSEEDDSQF